MEIYYCARAVFAKDYDRNDLNWDGYVSWQGLPDLEELITLDNMLCRDIMDFDQKNAEDWEFAVIREPYRTDFYKSLQYVLKKVADKERFNLLAVAIEPQEDCSNLVLEGFEFVGYDLLDESFGLSSLTNCDGFIISYTPEDLAQYGLLRDFEKAYDVKKKLLEDNYDQGHEVTRVLAVWRHTTIGRKIDG